MLRTESHTGLLAFLRPRTRALSDTDLTNTSWQSSPFSSLRRIGDLNAEAGSSFARIGFRFSSFGRRTSHSQASRFDGRLVFQLPSSNDPVDSPLGSPGREFTRAERRALFLADPDRFPPVLHSARRCSVYASTQLGCVVSPCSKCRNAAWDLVRFHIFGDEDNSTAAKMSSDASSRALGKAVAWSRSVYRSTGKSAHSNLRPNSVMCLRPSIDFDCRTIRRNSVAGDFYSSKQKTVDAAQDAADTFGGDAVTEVVPWMSTDSVSSFYTAVAHVHDIDVV
ncbi:hypothetical protein BKA62DRAFT_832405 [Auriculariales sp. MPI-PUGE-AT-0066]|nr:hypothetical protein BKA62DRAFT_832405 [Auriculariales sp. MPI-PUGE-AT-0066]